MIARILQNLELPRPSQIHVLQNHKSGISCHENSHDWRVVIASLVWNIWNILNRTHTHTHSHTSGRQLKIIFLDILKSSEYSDTNISKLLCSRKHSFLNEEAKKCESGFPYCVLADFTKFFLWQSMLLDFGFLTKEASWIHRI